MTSNATDVPFSPPQSAFGVAHGGVSQLSVRGGGWPLRADHILVLGLRQDRGQRLEMRKHIMHVTQGGQSDIEPATYIVAPFTDEADSRHCASSVVERTWTASYGILYVTNQGSDLTEPGLCAA